MLRHIFLVSLMLISSFIIFANTAEEKMLIKSLLPLITEGFFDQRFNPRPGNGRPQRNQVSAHACSDLDLAPYIKYCLCSGKQVCNCCKLVCNYCDFVGDCCQKVDDWGCCPVLCCAAGIWWGTASPCMTVSSVGGCAMTAYCLVPRAME